MWDFLVDNAFAVFLFATVILGIIAIALVSWKIPHPTTYARELLGEKEE